MARRHDMLLKMPGDLLRWILKCLGPSSLMLCSGVCRQMRAVVEADEMWNQFLTCKMPSEDSSCIAMRAKTQYLEGKCVHDWAMTDPYPVTNTFLLHLVDKMPSGQLRNAMSAAMRTAGPQRLSVMRVFRKGIISICDMHRLWHSDQVHSNELPNARTPGYQLCYYLMRSRVAHYGTNHLIECLDSGIVSFRDVERLWGTCAGLVYSMFAEDVQDNKQLRYACVSDLQHGILTLLQLENLWRHGHPNNTWDRRRHPTVDFYARYPTGWYRYSPGI
jgi:hypothetical protein